MKKILIALLLLISTITYSQSGVGYLNYVTYKLYGNVGYTNQYRQFAYQASDFDAMFNTANSNTTIYTQGIGTAAHTLVVDGNYVGGIPNGGQYFGVKVSGYFIPKETGTYTFGINSDDGSDLLINGAVVTSYYGGHGMSGYQMGNVNLVAGQVYTFMARFQQFGGGWGMSVLWKRPSQSTYSIQSDEVSTKGSTPSKQAKINFDFGGTLDKTKLSVGSSLSSSGSIDVTDLLDSTKIANGNKGTIVSGQAEWTYINTTNGTNTLYVDLRKFGNTDVSTITQMKILDVYEGPVTYVGSNIYWAYYTIPTTIPKLTNGTSTYASVIRSAGYDNYAMSCDITFGSVMQYKPQMIKMTSSTLSTLYSSIVTVSDVYLAFKELSNTGIFGNQIGNEFTYGIQYKNADVNDDGVFNETDCYLLLQHLTGKKNLVDTLSLKNTLKLIPTDTYNTIGKSNWSTFPTYLKDTFSFDVNTGKPIDTFNVSGTWKGDVNLSHSATPLSNNITTMSMKTMSLTTNSIGNVLADIMMEKVGDSIVTTISLNPNSNQIGAIQFDIYFDNSLLDFYSTQFSNSSSTNFSKNNGSSISVGSLNTSGGSVSGINYKITFKSKSTITNILGLISVLNVETLGTNSNKLNLTIQ